MGISINSSILNELESNVTLGYYASRLCHQLNNSQPFNVCVDHLVKTFEREDDVFVTLILQLFFSSVAILLNGIVLVALRKKPDRRKVDRLQEGFHSGIIANAIAYILYHSRRIYIMTHRSWAWSTPRYCILTGWQSLFFSISDVHLCCSLLFMSIDCLNAFAMRSALRRLTDFFIYHFWWTLLVADLLEVLLQFLQALPKEKSVLNLCWYYELFHPVYMEGHLIMVTICDMISGSIYLSSIALLILNRSQYNSVRAAQVKRQLSIMRQIVLVVSFCIVFQLIPFLFVMVSNYSRKNAEVVQVHLWTIQTFGFSMVPLVRLIEDPTVRKLIRGHMGIVGASKAALSMENHTRTRCQAETKSAW